MKSILLISALCLALTFGSVSGIECWKCSGEKDVCTGAEDNGETIDCPNTNTCYAADVSKYWLQMNFMHPYLNLRKGNFLGLIGPSAE